MKKFKISKFFKKKKINQNFQFHERIQDSQIFPKKKKINNQIFFQFLERIQDFQIFQKKKEGNFQKGPWD